MIVAQRRYEYDVVRPVAVSRPRRRKRASLLKALASNKMACILLFAAVTCIALNVYASAYARFTEKGYHRAALVSEFNKLKKDNEVLRLRMEGLQQPERIDAYALANGMTPSKQMAYLKSTGSQPRLAQSTESASIR